MKLDEIIEQIRNERFINDIEYFRNSLFRALKIPKEYMKNKPY